MIMSTYRGVPGTTFIWHGEYSDPEIEYKGHIFNYYDVEDGLWSYYCEQCEDMGIKPTEEGFDKWFEKHIDSAISDLEDLVYLAEMNTPPALRKINAMGYGLEDEDDDDPIIVDDSGYRMVMCNNCGQIFSEKDCWDGAYGDVCRYCRYEGGLIDLRLSMVERDPNISLNTKPKSGKKASAKPKTAARKPKAKPKASTGKKVASASCKPKTAAKKTTKAKTGRR